MMYNKLLIGGVVLIIIAALITPNAFLNYLIHSSKESVTVKLVQLPNCSNGSYKNKFLTIAFNGPKLRSERLASMQAILKLVSKSQCIIGKAPITLCFQMKMFFFN